MTVDTFETRRRKTSMTSPKVTTVLRFATTTPPIPVTVDTFETRRYETVLRFATICDSRRCATLSDTRERLPTDACKRLANLNATTSRRLLDPWTPTLKREPFCDAFGKRVEMDRRQRARFLHVEKSLHAMKHIFSVQQSPSPTAGPGLTLSQHVPATLLVNSFTMSFVPAAKPTQKLYRAFGLD